MLSGCWHQPVKSFCLYGCSMSLPWWMPNSGHGPVKQRSSDFVLPTLYLSIYLYSGPCYIQSSRLFPFKTLTNWLGCLPLPRSPLIFSLWAACCTEWVVILISACWEDFPWNRMARTHSETQTIAHAYTEVGLFPPTSAGRFPHAPLRPWVWAEWRTLVQL